MNNKVAAAEKQLLGLSTLIALIDAINVAEIDALKYFNAVNATLFTSGLLPCRK